MFFRSLCYFFRENQDENVKKAVIKKGVTNIGNNVSNLLPKQSSNNNIIDNEMNIDIDMNSNDQFSTQMSGNCCSPITETPQERCVHRTIVHEVPHA